MSNEKLLIRVLIIWLLTQLGINVKQIKKINEIALSIKQQNKSINAGLNSLPVPQTPNFLKGSSK